MQTPDARMSQARAELEGRRSVLLSAMAAHDTAMAAAIVGLEDMLRTLKDMRDELRLTRRMAADFAHAALEPDDAGAQRAAQRAAVEAGYSSLATYLARRSGGEGGSDA